MADCCLGIKKIEESKAYSFGTKCAREMFEKADEPTLDCSNFNSECGPVHIYWAICYRVLVTYSSRAAATSVPINILGLAICSSKHLNRTNVPNTTILHIPTSFDQMCRWDTSDIRSWCIARQIAHLASKHALC